MPAPYARIACFIDEDAASAATLAEAVSLRGMAPGELHLVHVAPTSWPLYGDLAGATYPVEEVTAAAGRWLRERADAVPGATAALLEGYAPGVACDYLRRHRIDLAVAAAHRGRAARALLGGFAAHLAYHAPCPVLLVRPPEPADGG